MGTDWKQLLLRAAPYLIRAALVLLGIELDETEIGLVSAMLVPSIKADSPKVQ